MEIISYLTALLVSGAVTVFILIPLIPKLKSLKMGQTILDIGPRWHKSKEGTPTMGGMSFIAASVVAIAAAAVIAYFSGVLPASRLIFLLVTVAMAVLNGVIGFIDDYIKVFKKRNEGLSAAQKYLLQLLVAGGYLFALRCLGYITTSLYLPFIDISVELGAAYYIVALLLITGVVNSVNLADGIDGLVSCESAVIGLFFALAYIFGPAFSANGAAAELLITAGALTGSCLGFLSYNFYPARIFMGDTGSLFLGGMTVGLGFLSGSPLIILLAGIMYIVETASVIIQVTSFKLTGRRVFKMSPIHHHFEKCGWSEIKIVAVFSLLTAAGCAIAFLTV